MKDIFTESADSLLTTVDTKLHQLDQRFNELLEPTRKSVLERFPILFTLLTTFGVVTTFLGFELLLVQTPYLYERPLLVLLLGVSILVITGTVYKKLG